MSKKKNQGNHGPKQHHVPQNRQPDPPPPPPPVTPPTNFTNYDDDTDIEWLKPFHEDPDYDYDWDPDFGQIFKWSLGITIASALWSVINDCDEVYNYYEPLHMLIYGHGFQTWEYSPTYALRSYPYLWLHGYPALLYSYFFGDEGKIAVFTMIRLTLGTVFALGECYAYEAIAKRINVSTGRFFLLFSWFSSGIFMARTAFVPSSFAMIICIFLIGAYLNEQWKLCITLVAFGSIIGWPFAAVLGLPIVVEMIILRFGDKWKTFLGCSAFAGFCFLALEGSVDQNYYGDPTVAVVNMIRYNFFNNKSVLYGLEPWTYYVKNLTLNWNFAWILSILGGNMALWHYISFWPVPEGVTVTLSVPWSLAYWKRFTPVFLLYSTMCIWLIIFFITGHKEERFLFPIYPLIALFAGIFCDVAMRMWPPSDKPSSLHGIYIAVIVFVALSASRSYATYANYSGHTDIYKSLQDELMSHEDFKGFNDPIRVCIGKEWHHFPSHFFIPQYALDSGMEKRDVELQFLQSDFRGILPKHFKNAKKVTDRTRHIPSDMNDNNKEEPSRYVDLKTCDYVIDVDSPATDRQQDFRTMEDQFYPIDRFLVIDAPNSWVVSRAFFIPFLYGQNVYSNCTLYRQIPVKST